MIDTFNNISRHFVRYALVGLLGASISSAACLHMAHEQAGMIVKMMENIISHHKERTDFILVEQFVNYNHHNPSQSFLESGYVPDTFIFTDKSGHRTIIDSHFRPVFYTDKSIAVSVPPDFISQPGIRKYLQKMNVETRTIAGNTVLFTVKK